MNGSLQLREYPGDIVRLSCEKCGRSGQYRKQKLIERYGADMRLPDLLALRHNAPDFEPAALTTYAFYCFATCQKL